MIVLVPERADYLFEILSPEKSVPRVVFSKQTVLISWLLFFVLFFVFWKMSVPGSTFGTRQFTRSHLCLSIPVFVVVFVFIFCIRYRYYYTLLCEGNGGKTD